MKYRAYKLLKNALVHAVKWTKCAFVALANLCYINVLNNNNNQWCIGGVYAGIRRIPTSGVFLKAYTHLSDHK